MRKGGHTVKEYRADWGALHLLQILICLVALLLCAAATFFLRYWEEIMWAVISVFAGAALVSSLLCLPLFFARMRFYATEEKLTVIAGILFLREQSIRLDRVQFIQTVTGPFDGAFGLNFIVLYVYGGQLTVAFLNKNDRYELIGLLERGGVFHAS
jgi:membrane protein YdbS with pleckstrin-like domain